MQLELLNDQGQSTAKVDAPDTVFARDYNEALVHQVVVAYQANARQGTRAQMTRAEVKHSTKKPFRQKGTGRARAGMTSSPIWRGGGRIADEHVQALKSVADKFEHQPHVIRFTDIRFDDGRLSPERTDSLGDFRRGFLRRQIVNDDVCPGFGQAHGTSTPDTP